MGWNFSTGGRGTFHPDSLEPFTGLGTSFQETDDQLGITLRIYESSLKLENQLYGIRSFI
jgi:hypothetical protein